MNSKNAFSLQTTESVLSIIFPANAFISSIGQRSSSPIPKISSISTGDCASSAASSLKPVFSKPIKICISV